MTDPFTMAVLVIGLGFMQHKHYAYLLEQKKLGEIEMDDDLRHEFDEYKKRVDSLTLRAGFKL